MHRLAGLLQQCRMDTKQKIETFEEIGMCDPFNTKTTLKSALHYASNVDFDINEYRKFD